MVSSMGSDASENLHASRYLAFIHSLSRMLAHGLKNRLAPAHACLDEIATQQVSPALLERYLNLAQQSVRETLTLCSAIETLAQIGANDVREVSLAMWLRELCAEVGVNLSTLELRRCAAISLDVGLWGAALRPLLQNVLDHGGGTCHMQARIEGAWLEVVIQDCGPGLGRLKPAYAREPTRRREGSPGPGLGLSRTELAVLLLGGSFELGDGLDGGVRLCVRGQCTTSAISA